MIRSHFMRLLCIGVILIGANYLFFRATVSTAPVPSSSRMKILGIWEITKSDDGTPVGTIIEFAKDGKVKVTTKVGDQTLNIEGTYTVDGNKLTLTIKSPEVKDGQSTDTLTITKLTDKELITKDQKGKSDEFKKKD